MTADPTNDAVALRLANVSRAFGGFIAMESVSLDVPTGERRAVIGPNGAGKSTLINVASGLLTPTSGNVLFNGRDVTKLSLHRRTRLGIGRTFQISSIFPRLTVFENVLATIDAARGNTFSIRPWRLTQWNAAVETLLCEVGLQQFENRMAEAISHGDRKRLELAMVLALEPELLLLDEPTAGMGMAERKGLIDLVERVVKERGLTLLFVEHDIDVVFRIADRITVMNRGRIFAEGSPGEIANNREVQEIYLGSRHFDQQQDPMAC